jgi:hypothetical protein
MDSQISQYSAISQASWQTRVDYAVAKKMLDSGAQGGEAAVRLIQAAAESQREMVAAVAKVTGSGGCVDCEG